MGRTDDNRRVIDRVRESVERQAEPRESGVTDLGGEATELPAGEGQYKVLQLDENDDPIWDYVRAH